MFGQMLFTQWKWARTEILAYTFAAFLVPTCILKVAIADMSDYSVSRMLGTISATGGFFVFLAFVCAVGFAVRPYLADQSLKHVYALSLPIAWPTFLRYRFMAGAVLLLAPTAAVFLGAWLAAITASIPSTLHAYPLGLSFRFYLSALEIYAAVFLLQHAAGKHATRVVIGIIAMLVIVELASRMLGWSDAWIWIWDHLSIWPGPFETLTARWMMIDV
jgi:hypothetical protein